MKNTVQKEIFVPRDYELEDILDVEEDNFDELEPHTRLFICE